MCFNCAQYKIRISFYLSWILHHSVYWFTWGFKLWEMCFPYLISVHKTFYTPSKLKSHKYNRTVSNASFRILIPYFWLCRPEEYLSAYVLIVVVVTKWSSKQPYIQYTEVVRSGCDHFFIIYDSWSSINSSKLSRTYSADPLQCWTPSLLVTLVINSGKYCTIEHTVMQIPCSNPIHKTESSEQL